ncbi:sialoadhesin-like isoform X2 [Acipenser ruthenus]|uniref:sialoadhesin-like isoform X2 n=1 Tax=Acipenser ruthenus TaxID=7906 RepID=UPI002740DB45|nr:sialoadhesin-like isoform X2 [Acipenser ruthenus]
MDFKLLVLSAYFQVFYRTTDCNSWTAEIPRKISAVKGSCVNIPCHFNYPGPRHPARDFVGIWYHGFFTAMVYNSKDISLVNAKFRHRTKLTGSLESNNCSLQIINLTPEDSLTYMFRVEIKGTQKYSYTQVTSQLIVSGTPEKPQMNCPQTLTEGVSVPVVCTIKYTCVKTPPQLMWSYSKGSINAIHEPEQGGVWEVKSVLTFIPASEDHSQTLQCRALYSDINDLISPGPSCKLHVQYAPKNVSVLVRGSSGGIKEGDTVSLSCVSHSNPPVLTYSWYRVMSHATIRLHAEAMDITVENVTSEGTQYYCSAHNDVGIGTSKRLHLVVQYAPRHLSVLVRGSAGGIKEGDHVSLSCVSDSLPPAFTYNWYRVINKDNIRLLAETMDITVENVTREESEYYCSAQNDVGIGTSKPIHLAIQYAPKNVSVLVRGSSGGIKEGDTVSLSCVSDSNPPVLTYSWYRVTSNETVRLHAEAMDITVENVTSEGTQYYCSAHNDVGIGTSKQLHLVVQYAPRHLSVLVRGSAGEIKEGDHVSLSCVSDSLPPAFTYSWYRVINKDNIRLLAETMDITVENVTREESEYYCSAQNDVGIGTSKPIHLAIQYAPKNVSVLVRGSSGGIKEGDTVSLSCVSDSNPPVLTYSWYRVMSNETIRLHAEAMDIIVENVTSEGTQYYCSAHNDVGIGTSKPLHLVVQYAPRHLSVLVRGSAGGIKEGDHVSLSCVSDSLPPAFTYNWYRVINKDNIRLLAETMDITVENVTREESEYYCSAQNDVGIGTSKPIHLAIQYAPKNVSVLVRGSSGGIKEGDTVSLSCVSDSNPPVLTYSWYRVTSNETVRLHAEAMDITVENVTSEGTQYYCSAHNDVGIGTSKQLHLVVQYAPRHLSVLVRGSAGEIKEGDHVSLSCVSDSLPPAFTYSWYRVINKDNIRLLAETMDITVENVTREESEYYCSAQNDVGIGTSKPIHLAIQYAPKNVSVLVRGSSGGIKEGDTVSLSCVSDSNPPVLTYSWYRVMSNETIRLHAEAMDIIVENVTSEGTQYYCSAHNDVGIGTSKPLHLVVQYAPRHLSVLVRGSAGGIKEGDHVSLSCVSDSLPPAFTYNWYRVINKDNIRLLAETMDITVENVTREESEYYCSAQNDVGIGTSKPIHLSIQYAPKNVSVLVRGSSGGIKEGDTVSLSCVSDSNPPVLTYSWYRVTSNETIQLHAEAMDIIVENVTSEGTQYYCSAHNDVGIGTSKPLHLVVQYAPRHLSVLVRGSAGDIKEGDHVSLSCVSDSLPPAFTYNWYRVINKDNIRLLAETMDITVENVTREESEYYCSAQNDVGIGTSIPIHLAIQYAPKNVSVLVRGSSGGIKEGDTFSLSCVSDSNPPVLTYSWYRVTSNETIQLNAEAMDITVENVTSEGTQYYCSAHNDVGIGTSKPLHLVVQYAPRRLSVLVRGSAGGIKEGDHVSLSCVSDSLPSAFTYNWYRVINKDNIRLLAETMDITVENVTREESEYYCSAQNDVGIGTSKPIHLYIQYAPKNVSVLVRGSSGGIKEGDTVSLSCVSDSNPPVLRYSWYRVMSNETIRLHAEAMDITVENVTSEGTQYYCSARNDVGIGTSKPLHLVVQYAPRHLSVLVRGSAGEIKEGDHVSLSCVSDSLPSAFTYNWYRVINKDNIRLLAETMDITVENVTREESEYYCSAQNDVGIGTSKPIHLAIQYPPKNVLVLVRGSSGGIKEGDTVSLSCVSDSNPQVLRYSWYRVTSNETIRLHAEAMDITVENVTSEGTQYFCSAHNDVGIGTSKPLHLVVQYAPRHLSVLVRGSAGGIKEGDHVSLSCVSDSLPPAFTYNWYRVINKDNIRLLAETMDITVENVTREESEYYCSAQNDVGIGTSKPIHLAIQYKPAILLQSSCVLGSEGVTCHCIAESNPPATITWESPDNDDQIAQNPQPSSLVRGHRVTSTLQGVTVTHGEISCLATNKLGSGYRNFSLQKPDPHTNVLIIIPAVLFGVVVILVIAVIYRRKTRKTLFVVNEENEDNDTTASVDHMILKNM